MEPERELHERIKMRLRLAGSSLSCVARELGVKATTVTSVSSGQRRSRRIEAKIAEKLSTTADQLWPDRYPGGCEVDEADPEAPCVPPRGLRESLAAMKS